MAYDKNLIGERIRELRKSRGYTQADIAKLRNVTQAAVAKQETGERSLGEEGLYWYAKHFSVSSDYLLGLIDTKNHSEAAPAPVVEAGTLSKEDLALPEKLRAYVDLLVEEALAKRLHK